MGKARVQHPHLRDLASRYGTSRLRIGMGTFVAIDSEAQTEGIALAGIEAAYAAFAQVERLMHPVREGSDLLAIRRSPLGRPVAVHAWTWEVLALSQRLNLLSAGVFDPCLPDSAGRQGDLELAAPLSVIAHSPLNIDLGGIAKGFAVDRALEALRAVGCSGGLVNAGGDLAVFGDRIHRVVVGGSAGRVVALENAALATSVVRSAAHPGEHRGYYHGRDLRPIRSGAVSVTAAHAADADALTKCLLGGSPSRETLLAAFDARVIECDLPS
jgi:FAD:protein FMN transferase